MRCWKDDGRDPRQGERQGIVCDAIEEREKDSHRANMTPRTRTRTCTHTHTRRPTNCPHVVAHRTVRPDGETVTFHMPSASLTGARADDQHHDDNGLEAR